MHKAEKLYYPYFEQPEDVYYLGSSFHFVLFAAINVKQHREIIALKDENQLAYKSEIF